MNPIHSKFDDWFLEQHPLIILVLSILGMAAGYIISWGVIYLVLLALGILR